MMLAWKLIKSKPLTFISSACPLRWFGTGRPRFEGDVERDERAVTAPATATRTGKLNVRPSYLSDVSHNATQGAGDFGLRPGRIRGVLRTGTNEIDLMATP